MNGKKTLGIVGCGAIGEALAKRADEKLSLRVSGIVVYDTAEQRSEALAKQLRKVKIAKTLEEAVSMSDIIVEAAHHTAAVRVIELAIENSKDAMIMSIGGLLGKESLLEKASDRGITVILPSGAVGGIDTLKAARIAGIESVVLTTRKPPLSLKGAPYLDEREIELESIKEETLIFEGSALEAVKAFPKNINVSAIISIAGVGGEKTKVRIITSPVYDMNVHEISVKSKAGNFSFRTENVPFPSNPKTSYLAALSAMTALEDYLSLSRVGT